MDRRRHRFEEDIYSIFSQFRSLLNELEDKMRDREEQIRSEVKEELLSNLESIYEDYYSEKLETRARRQRQEKDSFINVLKTKLGKSDNVVGRSANDSSFAAVFSRKRLSSSSTVRGRTLTQARKSIGGGLPTRVVPKTEPSPVPSRASGSETPEASCSKEDSVSYRFVTDDFDSDPVTTIVVPLNPHHFIGGPYKLEDEDEDEDEDNKDSFASMENFDEDPPTLSPPGSPHRPRRYRIPVNLLRNSNQCPFCHQTFSQRNSLNRHIRSHTGERPFPCNYCGKCFIDKERLKVHIRIHTGEKPFPCEICGRHFSQKSTVKRHMSVHTGEKPFRCSECNKGFGSKDNLKVHLRSHGAFLRFLQYSPDGLTEKDICDEQERQLRNACAITL